MKTKLFVSAAVLALVAGGALAQDLKFPVGEGAFNWDSYKAFDEATNLDGQTLTIFGPWRGEDQVLVELMLAYFDGGHRRDGELFVVGKLRAADRHRRRGRQPAGHRRPAAAGPDRRSGRARASSRRWATTTAAWLTENYAAGDSWVGLGTYHGPGRHRRRCTRFPTRST